MFQLEKALDSGSRAWQRGELDRAVSLLEEAHAEYPDADDATFPLARAVHELGQSDRAIALLETEGAKSTSESGRRAHRALIHYDLRDTKAFDADLLALGTDNPVARALRAVADARGGHWDVEFPSFTLSNAEINARLLVVLQSVYLGKTEPAQDEFHHEKLRYEPLQKSKQDAVLDEKVAAADRPPKSFEDEGEWLECLGRSFNAKKFELTLAIAEHDSVEDGWHDDYSASFVTFATLATAPAGKAVRRASRAIEKHGGSAVSHFLHALALIRDDDLALAGHAFARAARCDDLAFHEVITDLAKELEIDLRTD